MRSLWPVASSVEIQYLSTGADRQLVACYRAKTAKQSALRAADKEAKRKRIEEGAGEEDGNRVADDNDAPLEIGWDDFIKLFGGATSSDDDGCAFLVTFDDSHEFSNVTDPAELAREVAVEIWQAYGLRWTRSSAFCPLQYRGTISSMHRTIMNMHPMIPSGLHNGQMLTKEEIYEWAVREMHEYCFKHNLDYLWAYLWDQWYKPDHWKLWARAASDEIPRMRTTMMVESLWRVSKRKYFIDFHRPRLDLAIHLILVNAVPSIDIHLRQLKGTFRPGREDMLAEWQRDLKKEWEEPGKTDEEGAAARRPRDEGFATMLWDRCEVPPWWTLDLESWTCSCPVYALSRFMMCEHLVRLVNARLAAMPNFRRTELAFHAGLRRFHTEPF